MLPFPPIVDIGAETLPTGFRTSGMGSTLRALILREAITGGRNQPSPDKNFMSYGKTALPRKTIHSVLKRISSDTLLRAPYDAPMICVPLDRTIIPQSGQHV
jgi:hypothetical protein